MLYYENEEIELVMKRSAMLPRYAGLARKALNYYLGDLYNPEKLAPEIEYRMRFYISGLVELKVIDQVPYDWPVIDNFFRFFLNYEGFKHLHYDESVLSKGYNGIMRGNLPMHKA